MCAITGTVAASQSRQEVQRSNEDDHLAFAQFAEEFADTKYRRGVVIIPRYRLCAPARNGPGAGQSVECLRLVASPGLLIVGLPFRRWPAPRHGVPVNLAHVRAIFSGSSQMQHREDDSRLIGYPKVKGVGKSVQQCSANFARHGGELEWPLADARERSVDIAEEALGEPSSLVLVPPRGILEVGLSEWPNDEPAAHSIQWLC